MPKSFYFVDGIQADRTSRKLMRRHVMQGKNTGKKIHRRSRLEVQPARCRVNSSVASIARNYHGSLPGLCFPISVTKQSLDIIHEFFALTADKIYPAQLGISLHEAKLMYLKEMLLDKAAYQCNIALMQACNELFVNNGRSPPQALHHLATTFNQVKKRLQSDQALSDSTMAIVLSLVHQEQIRDQQWAAAIHMKGLQRMIELRGGLGVFEEGSAVLLKICKTDVMFALQHGGPTMFYRDCMPDIHAFMRPGEPYLDKHGSQAQHYQRDLCLKEVCADIMTVCTLFNSGSRSHKIDLATFHDIIVSPCYRLLRFRTLNEARQQSDLQSTVHLGLLIFMMTTFLQCSPRRLVQFELVTLCLKESLEKEVEHQENETILWLAIIGGIWISGDPDHQWLISKLRTLAQRLAINSWDEARGLIAAYPWIDVLHDKAGHQLWISAHDRC